MGCINSDQGFSHWFGNIHLSGPCNRSCYFCIGQHMMALDPLNNLKTWPLPGFDEFVKECSEKQVKEICLTGTNTDPLLFKHLAILREEIKLYFPTTPFALRTNAVAYHPETFRLFDKASITICSTNPHIYNLMMGGDRVPDVGAIIQAHPEMDIKINIVLGPENVEGIDLFRTLDDLRNMGVKRVNLREPYGQPHIGDPLVGKATNTGTILGMPKYDWDGMSVLYWDVHFVEVESVNLYANGNISTDYPVTRGHDVTGEVHPQEEFVTSGRIRQQWIRYTLPNLVQVQI